MISILFSRFRRSVFVFAVLCLGLSPLFSAEQLIAICGAYPPEMDALKKTFGVSEGNGFQRTVIHGVEFWRGKHAGKEIVVFRAGMSLVNAASQLQLALDRFPITHVLFAGVAGGVDPKLHVGDVVIPENWAYHGEAAYLNEDGKGGYVVPEYFTPKYENFGMIFPDEMGAVSDSGARDRVPWFAADSKLLEVARAVSPKLPPMKKAGRTITVSIGGTGVAGTVFLDNAKYREWIFKVWSARCVDMESTALAHVAYMNGKPILIVRGLSDLAGGQAGPNPISNNEASVSEIAATVLQHIVEAM